MFTHSVARITMKVIGVMVGLDAEEKCCRAERPISSTASSMKTKMPAAASVSNLRCPYG